jgi:hypothetical protein
MPWNNIISNDAFTSLNMVTQINKNYYYLRINSNSTANTFTNITNLAMNIRVIMKRPIWNNSNRMWGLVFKIYNSTNNLITTYSPQTSNNVDQSFELLSNYYFTISWGNIQKWIDDNHKKAAFHHKSMLDKYDKLEARRQNDRAQAQVNSFNEHAKKNGYSNASDVTEAFGVEIISADSLIEYYEEIKDCNDLNWKIIDKSYKNDDWQDEGIPFKNLK